MDLELALGRPVGGMAERVFRRWYRYAERKLLPQRRLELYLAQIAMLLSRHLGGSDAPLMAFLFDPPDPELEDADEAEVEAAREFFQFKPRARRAAQHG